MQQTPETSRPKIAWGVPASVSAHAIVLALLILGLPHVRHQPDEPKAIKVDLVPPKEKRPKPKAPAARKQEAMPAQTAAKARQTAAAGRVKPQSPKMLNPVFHFGQKDAGAGKSHAGNAAREAKAAPAPQPSKTVKKPDTPKQLAAMPQTPKPDVVTVPKPAPKPQHPVARIKIVHSQRDTGNHFATTAMGKLPRGIRAGELCATKLREQLRDSMPPYWPDLLPTYRLAKGTVLQVHEGAFRADAQWYNLSFRCKIDAAATRVESFAFHVGDPVPRGQWKARGFPSS